MPGTTMVYRRGLQVIDAVRLAGPAQRRRFGMARPAQEWFNGARRESLRLPAGGRARRPANRDRGWPRPHQQYETCRV